MRYQERCSVYWHWTQYIYISCGSLIIHRIPGQPCACLALLWRHNGLDGVSNHQPHDYLLNRLFRCRSKKTSKLHVTGLCAGNSSVTGEFPVQRPSNAENISIWWRHHGFSIALCFRDDLMTWKRFLHYSSFSTTSHMHIPVTDDQRCGDLIVYSLSAWMRCWIKKIPAERKYVPGSHRIFSELELIPAK